MTNAIVRSWRASQVEDAANLAEGSDLVRLQPLAGDPPFRYAVEFGCTGLVREGSQIVEANRFGLVVSFPPEHLRRAHESWELLGWLGPLNVWHPNIRQRLICIGAIAPGTGLVDILYRVFELITYQKFCAVESNALNADACVWTRANRHRLPVDARPLKWRYDTAGRGPAAGSPGIDTPEVG